MTESYKVGDVVQVLYDSRNAPPRARGKFFTVNESHGFYLILSGPRGGRVNVNVNDVIPIATR